MARFYITTNETTLVAANVSELYSGLKSIDVNSVLYIESYSNRHGYTDVTLKYLAK